MESSGSSKTISFPHHFHSATRASFMHHVPSISAADEQKNHSREETYKPWALLISSASLQRTMETDLLPQEVFFQFFQSSSGSQPQQLETLCDACGHELFPGVMTLLWLQVHATQTSPYNCHWCTLVIYHTSFLLCFMLLCRAGAKRAALLQCCPQPCPLPGQSQQMLLCLLLEGLTLGLEPHYRFSLANSAVPN